MGKCCLYCLVVHYRVTLHTTCQHSCFLNCKDTTTFIPKTLGREFLAKKSFTKQKMPRYCCPDHTCTYFKTRIKTDHSFSICPNQISHLIYDFFLSFHNLLFMLPFVNQRTCCKPLLPVITTEVFLYNLP